MLKTVRVADDSSRVTVDDSNNVYTGVRFVIIVAGYLMRNYVPPPNVYMNFDLYWYEDNWRKCSLVV